MTRTNVGTDPELGPVRRCSMCGEWWPMDEEFFYTDPRWPGNFSAWCKACYAQYHREKRQAKRAGIVPAASVVGLIALAISTAFQW